MRAILLALFIVLISPAEAAQPLPREVTVNGVEFVLVPEGWFWYTVYARDISEQNDERPRFRHAKIWLDDFYLARYEARARDFARFMNAGAANPQTLEAQGGQRELMKDGAQGGDNACTLVRRADGSFAESGAELPATNLSWALADEFARWMGFRLPTEAEWQKAARGPDKRIWPWGDFYPDDTYAVFAWSSDCHPAQVDSYPKSRSPYGIHHMAGNVAEYVADWYNQQNDDAMRDGMRNPAIAAQGSALAFEEPMKISKGGRWSRDVIGHAIAERRLMRPHGSTSREGARFALDAHTVRALVEGGGAVVTRN